MAQGTTPPTTKRQEVTGIALTFGRWMGGKISTLSGKVPQYTYSGSKNTSDSWAGAANYTFNGYNNSAPDGYQWFTTAGNDAYDECPNDGTDGYFDLGGWNGSKPTCSTFDIPCRGGYVYFEPTKNGVLTVYLLQNGCIDTYDTQKTVGGVTHPRWSPTGYITWRPIFITDEAGKEIEIDAANRVAFSTFQRSYSELVSDIQQYGNDKGNKVIRWRESQHVNKLYRNWITNGVYTASGMWLPGSDNDARYPWKAKGEVSEVIRVPSNLGGGYLVLEKGYVKYTFPVKQGKTYFVFSNYAKLGFCGFSFTSENNRPTEVLNIENNATPPAFTEGQQYKNVVLNGRTFEAGKWSSLCLPFSVSINQMRSIFGNDVETVHFNHIGEDDHVAYFDRHVYDQLYVAGVPVFIKPSETVSNPKFTYVTIDAPQPKNVYSEQYGYTFKGVYGSEDMGEYGYFINDKLYWLKEKTMQSGSMRAYFKATSDNTGSAQGARQLSAISFDEVFEGGDGQQTTGIVEIPSANAGSKQELFNVYSVSGTMVRRHVSSLEGLPKGVYVVNGKKVFIK